MVLLLPDEALEAHRTPAVLWSPESRSWLSGVSFGRDAGAFLHRDEMVNKPEVRAVVLSKLDLPLIGVLWTVGAGVASVAIEAVSWRRAWKSMRSRRTRGRPHRPARMRTGSRPRSKCTTSTRPRAWPGCPRPDRVFVQAGDSDVLEACLRYVAPGGRLVAASTSLAGALTAAERLGALVQVSVAGSERAPRAIGASPATTLFSSLGAHWSGRPELWPLPPSPETRSTSATS